MEIRVHKDNTTPEAIADMVRLNLGDILEARDDIPKQVPFKILVDNNTDFKTWILEIIQMSLFTSSLNGTEQENKPFQMGDVQEQELDKEKVEKVFAILANTTRADFIKYRFDLIKESQKENPNIVEV